MTLWFCVCLDLNECQDPATCNGGECQNLLGSYRCVCKDGLKSGPDGKSCSGKY